MLSANDFSERLWIIIDEAAGSEQQLRNILAAKPKPVIMAFDREFRRASDNLRSCIELTDASEDELKDLYAQVVSKGKSFYDFIVCHPERLLQDTKPGDPCYFGVASSILLQLFGDEIE